MRDKVPREVPGVIAQRGTASAYLQRLVELGVLRPSRHGRELYFINDALFAALAT